jgi:spore germination protein (amino acid permease)
MKVNLQPKESILINSFLLFFIIHSAQTGVGLVGLPRIVYLEVKHDGWIAVFLAGVITAVVLWFMIMMLKQYDSADLYGIHMDVFGKWVGSFLSIIYMIYLTASYFVIIMNYIEIVQVWIFPNLPSWELAFVLILLSVYAVFGGIRILAGVAFLSVVGTAWLALILFVPIRYVDTTHVFPIMNTDMLNLFKGIKSTTLSMMGLELILFIFPFVKEKKKVMLFAQLGNLYTTLLFTIVTLVAIMFFASDSLEKIIWPVLSMFKIVRLPNLERFEFIAVSFWMLIILPNMCLYLWAASKGFSRVLHRKQKWGILIIATLTFIASFFIKIRYQMNIVTDIVAQAGFLLAFCYPVMLSVIIYIKKKLVRRKKSHGESS